MSAQSPWTPPVAHAAMRAIMSAPGLDPIAADNVRAALHALKDGTRAPSDVLDDLEDALGACACHELRRALACHELRHLLEGDKA